MHHLRRPRAIWWESRSRHHKLAIGLDNASNWVTPSEQDVDEWPDCGLSPLPGQPDVFSCDVISTELFARRHAFRCGRKNLGLPNSAPLPRNGFPEWLIASSGRTFGLYLDAGRSPALHKVSVVPSSAFLVFDGRRNSGISADAQRHIQRHPRPSFERNLALAIPAQAVDQTPGRR